MASPAFANMRDLMVQTGALRGLSEDSEEYQEKLLWALPFFYGAARCTSSLADSSGTEDILVDTICKLKRFIETVSGPSRKHAPDGVLAPRVAHALAVAVTAWTSGVYTSRLAVVAPATQAAATPLCAGDTSLDAAALAASAPPPGKRARLHVGDDADASSGLQPASGSSTTAGALDTGPASESTGIEMGGRSSSGAAADGTSGRDASLPAPFAARALAPEQLCAGAGTNPPAAEPQPAAAGSGGAGSDGTASRVMLPAQLRSVAAAAVASTAARCRFAVGGGIGATSSSGAGPAKAAESLPTECSDSEAFVCEHRRLATNGAPECKCPY